MTDATAHAYARAAQRERLRFLTLLQRGVPRERLETDVVLKARARAAERARLKCSQVVIDATQSHTKGVKP